jgi:hypothetical protein
VPDAHLRAVAGQVRRNVACHRVTALRYRKQRASDDNGDSDLERSADSSLGESQRSLPWPNAIAAWIDQAWHPNSLQPRSRLGGEKVVKHPKIMITTAPI